MAREGRRFWVSVRCVDVPSMPLEATGQQVGIDLGVCAQVATSDGQVVVEGRYGQQARARLEAAQRNLASKTRGSGHRARAVEQVAAAHRKVRNQRKDLAHKLSRELVNAYDLIVHEDLKITSMVRRPKARKAEDGTYEPNGAAAKAGLNRSIADAGWGDNSCSSWRTKRKTLVARSLPWTPATAPSGARLAGTSLEVTGSPRPSSDVRAVGTRPTPTSTRPSTSCGPVGPDRLRPVQGPS